MPTPRRDRTTEMRWQRWQERLVSQRSIPRDAAVQGFTLLKIAPETRAAFFACVEMLQAQPNASDPVLQGICEAWATWTHRLAAYLTRRASGRPGTLPPLPEPLRSLMKTAEGSDAH